MAFLSAFIFAVLAALPEILQLSERWIAKREADAPSRRREKIDEVLTEGDPLDVAAALSGLYDEAYDPARQPTDAVPDGGTAAVPAVRDRRGLSQGHHDPARGV